MNKAETNEQKKKAKQTQEDILSAIQLKSIEKDCLDRVFKLLCELQEQPSSDDDNKQKKYLMEIEKRANQKKMKLVIKDKPTVANHSNSPKKEKRYKEDENSKQAPGGGAVEDVDRKVGVKAVRKILKKLEQEVVKDEMQLMIWVFLIIVKLFILFIDLFICSFFKFKGYLLWIDEIINLFYLVSLNSIAMQEDIFILKLFFEIEKIPSIFKLNFIYLLSQEVDEDLDGLVSEKEFEKMYKRCILDEREQEPKRLFYLVQFLMYDKERKGYITEEDTLEILYIRHEDRFTAAIEDIFE